VLVAADHLVRGLLWPESVYGITNPEWWRFLEHAGWVVFEDVVLVLACLDGVRQMRTTALRTAEKEAALEGEQERTQAALDMALADLRESQEAKARAEKLAAVGELGASVGHELRNPLAAIRNASTYIGKRLADPAGRGALDPKVPQFLRVIEREVDTATKFIGDLLDFARERPPRLGPCPLRALVEEAIELLPETRVPVVNQVAEDLPIPDLDRDQFRQIVVNLAQNAIEAMPADRAEARVVIHAEGGEAGGLRLTVEDNGSGIAPDVTARLFEPLFTTKAKGTGLGLAIVANNVKGHGGSISVESQVGKGTRFVVDLPPAPRAP